jgi:hypothetical protein
LAMETPALMGLSKPTKRRENRVLPVAEAAVRT